MKLKEIAAGINAHLNRFERDPKINLPIRHKDTTTRSYFWAGAHASGNRVFVTYINYQGPSSLTKAKAEEYLAWLNGGGIGRHNDMERSNS